MVFGPQIQSQCVVVNNTYMLNWMIFFCLFLAFALLMVFIRISSLNLKIDHPLLNRSQIMLIVYFISVILCRQMQIFEYMSVLTSTLITILISLSMLSIFSSYFSSCPFHVKPLTECQSPIWKKVVFIIIHSWRNANTYLGY